MAKQEGLTVLNGKVGDLIYYTSRYGKQVRRAPEISLERIRTAPEFAGRRDASSEFGYASRVGRLLRLAVKRCCTWMEQGNTHNKLAAHILNTVKQDKENARGKRRLTAGNATMLEGFSWRERVPVNSSLLAGYEVVLDTVGRTATLNIATLVPKRDFDLGEGATHAQIVLVLICVDYDNNSVTEVSDRTGMIDLGEKGEMNVSLSSALPDNGGNVFVAGIGVQGYQQVAGSMNELRSGNGFEIVKARVIG